MGWGEDFLIPKWCTGPANMILALQTVNSADELVSAAAAQVLVLDGLAVWVAYFLGPTGVSVGSWARPGQRPLAGCHRKPAMAPFEGWLFKSVSVLQTGEMLLLFETP